MFKRVLIIGLLFISPVASSDPTESSDWKFISKVDSMTDEHTSLAVTTNKEGFSFGVYRNEEGGEVWGIFRIPNGKIDQIDSEKLIIYSIDKNEPIDLSDLRLLEVNGILDGMFEWEPKWVNFRIWHGAEDESFSPVLRLLMEGKTLLIRYYLPAGGYEEVSFSLKGSQKLILQAIDLDMDRIKEIEAKHRK